MALTKIKHQVSIPSTTQETDATTGKEYTVYNVTLRTKDETVVRQRRFNNFKSFHQEWTNIYPNLAPLHKLPDSYTLFKNNPKFIQERQMDLTKYLRGVSSVKCLQPFFCKFMETPLSMITIVDKNASKLRSTNTNTASVFTMDTNVKHGNTDSAAVQAAEMKRKFIEQNKDLLEMLMPGQELELGSQSVTLEEAATVSYARALGDFIPETGEESARCIRFYKDDVIEVIDNSGEDWWYGKFNGDEGYFPGDFVTPCPKPRINIAMDISGGAKNLFSKGLEKTGFSSSSINYDAETDESLRLAKEDPELKVSLKTQKDNMKFGAIFKKYGTFLVRDDNFFYETTGSNKLGFLYWCKAGKRDLSNKRCIDLSRVTDIYVGKQTKAFESRTAKGAIDCRCFSIRTSDEMHDLEAKDKPTRDGWVVCLIEILGDPNLNRNEVNVHRSNLNPTRPKSEVAMKTIMEESHVPTPVNSLGQQTYFKSEPIKSKPVQTSYTPKPVQTSYKPEPIQPKTRKPEPIQPKSYNPKPVQPKSYNPKPVQPKSYNPKPVQPKSYNTTSSPGRPVSIQPIQPNRRSKTPTGRRTDSIQPIQPNRRSKTPTRSYGGASKGRTYGGGEIQPKARRTYNGGEIQPKSKRTMQGSEILPKSRRGKSPARTTKSSYGQSQPSYAESQQSYDQSNGAQTQEPAEDDEVAKLRAIIKANEERMAKLMADKDTSSPDPSLNTPQQEKPRRSTAKKRKGRRTTQGKKPPPPSANRPGNKPPPPSSSIVPTKPPPPAAGGMGSPSIKPKRKNKPRPPTNMQFNPGMDTLNQPVVKPKKKSSKKKGGRVSSRAAAFAKFENM